MSHLILTLLKKEANISTKNKSLIFFAFFLPLILGMIFGAYREAVPRDAPALIVAENESVSYEKLLKVKEVADTFSSPEIGKSVKDGLPRLIREEIYMLIEVEGGESLSGTYKVYYDNTFVPVSAISSNVIKLVNYELEKKGGSVKVEGVKIGKDTSLPEFFFSGVIVLLSSIVALEVIPFNAAEERRVIGRIKTAVPIYWNVLAKFIFSLILFGIQLIILVATYIFQEIPLNINAESILIILLTLFYLNCFGLSIMFLTYFTDIGRHLCTILIGLIIFLSSAFYPAGFFPGSMQFLSRLLPTYYSVVLIRILTLKDADFSVISDYLLLVVLFAIISAITLFLSYRRVKNWSMQL